MTAAEVERQRRVQFVSNIFVINRIVEGFERSSESTVATNRRPLVCRVPCLTVCFLDGGCNTRPRFGTASGI
jgi:hypothetical protein